MLFYAASIVNLHLSDSVFTALHDNTTMFRRRVTVSMYHRHSR